MSGSKKINGYIKALIAVFICLTISTAGFAQFKKGEKLFEKGRYSDNI